MKKLALILAVAAGLLSDTALAAPPTRACTASNAGEVAVTWNNKHTRQETYVCDSGWQLIRVCQNGICEDY